MELRNYRDRDGNQPFIIWRAGLDETARARVNAVLARIEEGNLSNAKSVGEGVSEYRIHFGPGYRIYFGMDGETLVILLGGGTKKRQARDIATAKSRWADYKQRKQDRKKGK